ncbi:hypothetical protein DL764_003942 [Monosporascus ibericus]|uniref:ribonuclease H n=1 Tax=Monosporascus ibericus TaxID=155417 RepID=A0A4Q4TEM3_9PEZI|nr:hypothetical protein DL764_003942 [Monosporascus ibericus]
MVYLMKFYVDGGCRGNGQPGSIGAAAAVLTTRGKRMYYKTTHLPRDFIFDDHNPTNQRAEIAAIILALEWALEKYQELNSDPYLTVEIHSDSRYAIGCMTQWIYKWHNNGWTNSSGYEVANRDLIQRASELDDEIKELGEVDYIWIPREQNTTADKYCNEALDEQDD